MVASIYCAWLKDGVMMANAGPWEEDHAQRIRNAAGDCEGDGTHSESIEKRLNRKRSEPAHCEIGNDVYRREAGADDQFN